MFIFSSSIFNRAECLICYQEIKHITEYSLKRHYESCHSEYHSVFGSDRTDLINTLKKQFELRNARILHIANNKSVCNKASAQFKASYVIGLALAKKGRPFEDGVFLKDLYLEILQLFGLAGEKIYQCLLEQSRDALKISDSSSNTKQIKEYKKLNSYLYVLMKV